MMTFKMMPTKLRDRMVLGRQWPYKEDSSAAWGKRKKTRRIVSVFAVPQPEGKACDGLFVCVDDAMHVQIHILRFGGRDLMHVQIYIFRFGGRDLMHFFACNADTVGVLRSLFCHGTAMRFVVCDRVSAGLQQDWEETREARPL
jgi:hypothetical protein